MNRRVAQVLVIDVEVRDIAFLFRLDGVSRDEVKQYFERADLMEKWHELTQAR